MLVLRSRVTVNTEGRAVPIASITDVTSSTVAVAFNSALTVGKPWKKGMSPIIANGSAPISRRSDDWT